MSILRPIPGSADAIDALAAALHGSADDLRSVLGGVRGLGVGGVWDGPAGAAFAARVTEAGPVLQRILDRYVTAAQALRTFAPELDRAQRSAQRAITEGDDADGQIRVLEGRLNDLTVAGQAWESPAVQSVLAEQRRQVARRMAAEAAHDRAWSDVEAADGRCAATLRATADDALADPGLYRFLRSVSSVGAGLSTAGPVALVNPELGPVCTMAGTAGSVADLGLVAIYGEGDWGQVGIGLGLSSLSFAGGALKSGAKVGAAKGVNGSYSAERAMATRERLAAGLRSQAKKSVDGLHGLGKVPSGSIASSAVVGISAKGSWKEWLRPEVLRDRAKATVTAQANKHLLDDLRMVRANGTTTMYVSGVTLKGAAAAGSRVQSRVQGTVAPPTPAGVLSPVPEPSPSRAPAPVPPR